MISTKMHEALNNQINAEFYSAYLYLSMGAYFESINLPGLANWMQVQFQEETAHAMKIFNYVHERGGKVQLKSIDCPQTEWSSPLSVFEDVYKHEQKVTGLINELVNLALSESDHATNNFLQWFVAEQVEEEANADEIRQRLKLIGDSPNALFMLDRELGNRIFTPPATEGE